MGSETLNLRVKVLTYLSFSMKLTQCQPQAAKRAIMLIPGPCQGVRSTIETQNYRLNRYTILKGTSLEMNQCLSIGASALGKE